MPRPLNKNRPKRTTKRERIHLDLLDPETREALTERFYAECARVTDPFEAAERIGCEIRTASDGAPELYW